MKSTELRIGNWVLHKDVIQFVESINDTDSGVAICCLSEHDNGCVNIKPIPLTEEWLVKFGFRELTDGKNTLFIKRQHKDFEVMQSASGNNYWVEFNGVRCYPFTGMKVNQLQNLYFALTGEELTIKEQK